MAPRAVARLREVASLLAHQGTINCGLRSAGVPRTRDDVSRGLASRGYLRWPQPPAVLTHASETALDRSHRGAGSANRLALLN
jgi:hypothetical protein